MRQLSAPHTEYFFNRSQVYIIAWLMLGAFCTGFLLMLLRSLFGVGALSEHSEKVYVPQESRWYSPLTTQRFPFSSSLDAEAQIELFRREAQLLETKLKEIRGGSGS